MLLQQTCGIIRKMHLKELFKKKSLAKSKISRIKIYMNETSRMIYNFSRQSHILNIFGYSLSCSLVVCKINDLLISNIFTILI